MGVGFNGLSAKGCAPCHSKTFCLVFPSYSIMCNGKSQHFPSISNGKLSCNWNFISPINYYFKCPYCDMCDRLIESEPCLRFVSWEMEELLEIFYEFPYLVDFPYHFSRFSMSQFNFWTIHAFPMSFTRTFRHLSRSIASPHFPHFQFNREKQEICIEIIHFPYIISHFSVFVFILRTKIYFIVCKLRVMYLVHEIPTYTNELYEWWRAHEHEHMRQIIVYLPFRRVYLSLEMQNENCSLSELIW